MQKILQLMASNRHLSTFKARANVNAQGQRVTDLFVYGPIANDREMADAFGGIDPETFNTAVHDATGPINLYVNSPGGSVFAAVAMGAALRRHGQPVNAFIDGLAASAASVLTTYADSVEASEGSFVMIHNAWTMGAGNAADFRAQADLLDQIDSTIVQAYVKQTGQTEQQVREWMAAETWFEAKEAVSNGFANRVAGQTEQVANWDLAAFDKAPQQIAASADVDKLKARLRLARALAGC